ncbi:MAG: nucleotidyltransferase domain-containing protein [Candidatus Electrothrix sp. LOE1_4_5]|nr:nucleotidyltransferase domain-containing protein [Candidatus Electrothrix gigas]MCI5226293.1 nucleotidyltransferase domain-containing protein [Candidatus Electrothrix gigas]
MSANATRQDSDRDFLIIADHPLDREIITKLKDGLYDIELENDEVVSSIIRSRQEWSSPAYDALLFKKAVEKEGVEL